ncbi:hypothetical protein J2R99_000428 [Rhodopseudomonas julia]|uniref:DUF4238 domain-containing protein n=1 Tax=Rhodopseudomonas julia TaxID=200617 RepID=A0ABU0C3N6_9BRAD|nr:DUF4238 domain-containing protein [Rhodopseudomonas julia]MDQ0324579.1 hypothetical protein [Rhodopseudomonas julia]
MVPTNPPTKHHFIPAFYLRGWQSDVTGKLTEYSNPYQRKVVIEEKTAESTGYEKRLYELKGYEPALAQQVETEFFSAVDNFASRALVRLKSDGTIAPCETSNRSAWSRFVMSLLLRCPEDIAMFRELWQDYFIFTDAESESRYQARRDPGDPDTLSEYLTGLPLAERERQQFEILCMLIDHEVVGATLNEMHWWVIQTVPDAPTLLTSDRPVICTALNDEDGHVILPLGPRLLWIGANDVAFIDQVRLGNPVGLVNEVNRQVVEGAKRYVWGADASQLRFVKDRFGRDPQPRHLESVVARRRAAMMAK